jgi:hypothetical protein
VPTAVQSALDAHDTPASLLNVAPARLGVLCTCQLVPFQPSANVIRTPALLSK